MHSVFVHCVKVTRTEIADWVGGRSVKGLREHWYVPNRNDPIFTVRFPHEGAEFSSAENRRHVVELIGREPDVTVQLDAGGKHPGHKELRAFITELLSEYSGVALDDLSPHVWTLEDLRSDKHVNGFAFADHESWRKLHAAHHPAPPAKTPHR
ncbi:MAG: hypothetical protein SGI72_17160 [Planctomycetota bacterium]|nr:hypothetical protein [Planctomycetota bacterium]